MSGLPSSQTDSVIEGLEGKSYNTNDNKIYKYLSVFLINNNNSKTLSVYYNEFCIFGYCLLITYIILIIFSFLYMRNKYYFKKNISYFEEKIQNVNKSHTLEKIMMKIISFFFFLIAFFHQYIIEYYFIGYSR